MEARQSFDTVAGWRVSLLRGGSGPPLLYLHGAGGAGRWMPFMEALPQKFDVRDQHRLRTLTLVSPGGIHNRRCGVPFARLAAQLSVKPGGRRIGSARPPSASAN